MARRSILALLLFFASAAAPTIALAGEEERLPWSYLDLVHAKWTIRHHGAFPRSEEVRVPLSEVSHAYFQGDHFSLYVYGRPVSYSSTDWTKEITLELPGVGERKLPRRDFSKPQDYRRWIRKETGLTTDELMERIRKRVMTIAQSHGADLRGAFFVDGSREESESARISLSAVKHFQFDAAHGLWSFWQDGQQHYSGGNRVRNVVNHDVFELRRPKKDFADPSSALTAPVRPEVLVALSLLLNSGSKPLTGAGIEAEYAEHIGRPTVASSAIMSDDRDLRSPQRSVAAQARLAALGAKSAVAFRGAVAGGGRLPEDVRAGDLQDVYHHDGVWHAVVWLDWAERAYAFRELQRDGQPVPVEDPGLQLTPGERDGRSDEVKDREARLRQLRETFLRNPADNDISGVLAGENGELHRVSSIDIQDAVLERGTGWFVTMRHGERLHFLEQGFEIGDVGALASKSKMPRGPLAGLHLAEASAPGHERPDELPSELREIRSRRSIPIHIALFGKPGAGGRR